MREFVAIIGDLKNSRNLDNRRIVQELLDETLKDINTTYKPHIASDFIITLGDEFQGLLTHIDPIFSIIEKLNLIMMDHITIRYGIGIGTIETSINQLAAIGADGPAYHNAREMLIKIKKLESSHRSTLPMILMKDSTWENSTINMINSQLTLISRIVATWSHKQRQTISSIRKTAGSQIKVAKQLKVQPSTIHRRLISADFYQYDEAIESLLAFLIAIRSPHES